LPVSYGRSFSRYYALLMGSVIDGEDVVQDTFARAYVAVDDLQELSADVTSKPPGTIEWE
jgi:DNA-directed RNA polymerase specialized sigma24 family protein